MVLYHVSFHKVCDAVIGSSDYIKQLVRNADLTKYTSVCPEIGSIT